MRTVPAPVAIAGILIGGVLGWVLHHDLGPHNRPGASSAGGKSAGSPVGDQDVVQPWRQRPHDRSEDSSLTEGPDRKYTAGVEADLRWRIASLKSALGLRPDQVAKLEDAARQSVERIGKPESDEDAPPEHELAETLSGVLDAEQSQKYTAWLGQRDQAAREAETSKQLAELEGSLLLDPDQREAIRKDLMDRLNSQPAPEGRPPVPRIDPRMLLEVEQSIGEDAMNDPSKFQPAAQAWIDQHITTELDAMKGSLHPDQIETYRQMLEREYRGWLGDEP